MTAKLLVPFFVFVVVVTVAVAAYLLTLRRDEPVQRSASWIAAAVWTLIAAIITAFFGMFVADLFRIATFQEIFAESIIGGVICVGLWIVALTYVRFALWKTRSR
jgi:hypothetical protein